jgi:hypothetical protein
MLIAAAATGAGAFIGIVGFLVIAALYFLPTIVATSRKVTNTGSVFVINLLLGWSVIGWVVALAMAVKSKTPQVVVMTSSTPLPACAKCGVALTPGQQFCSNCGTARLITN